MARKNQTLLNYRTATKNMPLSGDVQHGEIVVRYATDQPELLIKKENQEFATFIDSEAIKTLIAAGGETAAGQLKSFSASVVANYATSAATVGAIKSASGNIETTIKTLSGNVVTYVKTVSGNIETKINTVSGNIKSTIETVKGDVTSLSDELHKGYWTSSVTESKINEKINAAVSSVYKVKGSVNKFAELPTTGNVEGDVYNVVEANGTTPAGTNYVWVVKGESNGHWDPLGGTVDLSEYAKTSEVEQKVGVVSKELETFKTNVSNTYATKASVTTLSGNTHSAIAVVSGKVTAIETSLRDDYWTSAETQIKINGLDTKISQNTTNISALSASVVNNYATSASTVGAIKSASGNIETTIKTLSGNVVTYINTVSGNIKSTIETVSGNIKSTIETVDGRVTTLDNKLTQNYATSADTVTALRGKLATAKFDTVEGAATSTQSGAKMLVGGNTDSKTLTIDLSALVIDCGTF